MRPPASDVSAGQLGRRAGLLAAWRDRLLLRPIARSSFLRNVTITATGSITGQLIQVAASPILTRLYTPAEFGVLSIYMSVCSILVAIATLRYDQAIPLPQEEGDAADVLALALAAVLLVALMGWAGAEFLGPRLVAMTSQPTLVHYLWLVPLTVAGGGTYVALTLWAIRKQAYRRLAITKITRSTGQSLTQVGLGLVHAGPLGLIIGFAVGQLGGNGSIALEALRTDAPALRRISLRGMLRAARRHLKFPLYSCPSALLVAVPLQIPPLLIALYYGVHEAGLFNLASSVLRQPATLCAEAVGQVFFGKAAATLRDQPSQLPRLFFTTAGVLFAAGIIPALLLMLFAGPLVRFVFGGAWADAGAYVQLMALALLAGITVSTVSPIISVTQKQDWQLAVDIIRTVLVLAVFYIAHLVHASALTAVGAYVGVLLITYGLFFGVFSLAAFAGARQTRLEGPGGTAPGAE